MAAPLSVLSRIRHSYDYPEEKTMTKGIGLCLQAMELPDESSA